MDVEGRAWWRPAVAVISIGWAAQQFTPLLLMYQDRLGLAVTTVDAMLGIYVVGLIPGLLLGGPVSDRFGRRRVMAPTLVISIVSTVLSMAGGARAGWLFAGRLVTMPELEDQSIRSFHMADLGRALTDVDLEPSQASWEQASRRLIWHSETGSPPVPHRFPNRSPERPVYWN